MPSNCDWVKAAIAREEGPVPFNFSLSPPTRRLLETQLRHDASGAGLGLPHPDGGSDQQ